MAKTQSTIAKQAAEIESLKRGQVPPQQLDNNSPAPAANASNDQRMLDAYLQGDRSPAALAAVSLSINGLGPAFIVAFVAPIKLGGVNCIDILFFLLSI